MDNGKTTSRRTIQNILIRDYVLSFLVFFGFLAANHALSPTLPIYLARLGSNEREIGFLVGAISVSSLFSRFLVGGVLRKYSEKRVMMWGAMLFALTFLALIMFRPFWPLVIVRLLQGLAFASLDTAAIAYVIRIIPLANRPRAISYFLLGSPLASAMVASSAVFVVNEYSFTILLLGCTGLSVCAFLLSWKLKGPETAKPAMISPVTNRLFFERKILAPAMVSFLFSFSWGGLAAFFPLYAIQCGVRNPGHFFSAMAVILIVARFLGGRMLDTYSKEKIIPIVIFVSMGALVLLAFLRTLPMFIFVGMLWGVGGGFLPPVSMAYALEYAGSSDGTAVGTYQAFMDLGFALGPAIMGVIIPLTGYRAMFLCLGFVCFINVCYFQFYLRKKGNIVPTRE
jgi:MFS family permease